MKSHKELYPEQYGHPLVGKMVRHKADPNLRFKVLRVVPSRFGPLAVVGDKPDFLAYGLWDLVRICADHGAVSWEDYPFCDECRSLLAEEEKREEARRHGEA